MTETTGLSAAELSDLDEETLVKAAKEALTRPSDFGYFGDLPLFESWGLNFSQTRDSYTVERSNYRTIKAELEGRAVHDDGDQAENDDASLYVQEIHCGHWLYGWQSHLAVRVLEDAEGPTEADNLTHTFVRAVEIARYLRDEYPIFDESDYCELESEEQEAAWDPYIKSNVLCDICEHFGVDDVSELQLRPADIKYDGYNSIGEMYSATNEEAIREAYYRHESTEWIEESGNGFYNAQHEKVVLDLIRNLFVPRAQQIEHAHSDALREDAIRYTDANQLEMEI